jgi:tetratricopeptide (TPR) repeat protein
MIDEKTLESAKHWCKVGAQWVDKGAHTTGIRYLDQAIAVFEEVKDLSWLTYARHQKLQALRSREALEDAERLADDVLRGYAALDDSYGKALALSHSADCAGRLGRGDAAAARLNLASAVAESAGHPSLLAYILMQKGGTKLEQGCALSAMRDYRRAEALFQKQSLDDDAAKSRCAAAEVLALLGERAEAIAMLEDTQSHFFTKKSYRDALRPLSLLKTLYDQARLNEDRMRVQELIHYCGQYIIQGGDSRIRPAGESAFAGEPLREPATRLHGPSRPPSPARS